MLCCRNIFGNILFMCCALYAPIPLLCDDENNIPLMDKLYYFVLQTERMIPIFLEDK